jgi:subtilisin family serine protease
LDTGCFRHDAFKQVNFTGKNFVDNNDDFKDISTGSHGTFVSGIIAAGNIPGAVMTGVAPEVNLFIAKITAESDIIDVNPILEGLEWLLEQKPDIINCSFDFSATEDLNKFQQIFSSQQAKSVLWVAAGQDNEGLFNKSIYFPAKEENFIAIGSVRKAVLAGRNISDINSKIKYVLNEVSFTSTNIFNGYKQNVGSSFASAYLTAHLALIKSHLIVESPENAEPSNCISFLDQQLSKLNLPEFSEKPFAIFLK